MAVKVCIKLVVTQVRRTALGLDGAAGGRATVAVMVGVAVTVGVGVGGMATVGNVLASPVTVAYCPHNQHVSRRR